MKNFNLVVGAGFSGATVARCLAEKNEKVIVIDRKEHIAGNCYDYRDENGIMIHKYGPHIFHTSSEKVWAFLKNFTSFNTYMHKVLGLLDGIETHIPFNLNTLHDVFPESLANRLEEKLLTQYGVNKKIPILEFKKQKDSDLQFLADYVYEKIFKNYTAKQWGTSPDDMDGSVTARVPVYISKDNRYFQDKYQGIPLEGYTKVVENILNNKNIEVRLKQDFSEYKDKEFLRVFYSGSIDEYFSYKYGVLPYRSVNFKFEHHKVPYYQNNACINYPDNYDFTRIHEYKYYLNDQSKETVIAKEYSEFFELGRNERYYPIPNAQNAELYEKYLADAKQLKNVYFLGRLGDYKYYNMDNAIERALEVAESL